MLRTRFYLTRSQLNSGVRWLLSSMKTTIALSLALAAVAGCYRHSARAAQSTIVWESAPLAPPLRFAESIEPREVAVLAIDAHSGAPVREAVARLDATQRMGVADSLGRIQFRDVPVGRYVLRIQHPGHWIWRDSIEVRAAAGLAVVVQLRRSASLNYDPPQDLAPKPPNTCCS